MIISIKTAEQKDIIKANNHAKRAIRMCGEPLRKFFFFKLVEQNNRKCILFFQHAWVKYGLHDLSSDNIMVLEYRIVATTEKRLMMYKIKYPGLFNLTITKDLARNYKGGLVHDEIIKLYGEYEPCNESVACYLTRLDLSDFDK